MVMFIPLFSLTLASCGDDDNDEPDNTNKGDITSSFLEGSWTYNVGEREYGINVFSDGTYTSSTWIKTYSPSHPYNYVVTRGNWILKNNKLSLVGSVYFDNEYIDEYKGSFQCFYDKYTNVLKITRIEETIFEVVPTGNFKKVGL